MKFKIFIISLYTCMFISFILYFSNCNNSKNSDYLQNKNISYPRMNDTIINLDYDSCFTVSTMIKYPSKDINIKGIILMLHGWGLNYEEWCNNTSICDKALEDGYILIIPDYGKSNYTHRIYPQTIAEYRRYPTLGWIIDEHIHFFQTELKLLLPSQKNFVVGLSTGARGATLLAYYLPGIFKAVASISGDFDITKMQDEYLYYSFLGDYKDFPDRWKNECFAYDCKNYMVSTYIAHGIKDATSPPIQSLLMLDSITSNKHNLIISYNFPIFAGHDYEYWESETDNILDFFNSF